MADHGGHGGSTRMETEIPIIFFNEKLFSSVHRNNYLQLQKFNQIDFTATISCLFNLSIPDQNDGNCLNFLIYFRNLLTSIVNLGVTFIDEILTDKHYHLKNFHCLNENFKQLDRKFNLLQNPEVKHKYHKIRNEYESTFGQEEQTGFKKLAINFKTFMKSLVSQHVESNQNYNQTYWMEISLIGMTLVLEILFKNLAFH